MRVARKLVVSGRVQGVGFRFHVLEAARRAGAAGWVRNSPDGTVEALIQGERAAVDQVEVAVRQGPPGSRVTGVVVTEQPADGRVEGFRVE